MTGLTRSCTGCTHMATVDVKGLSQTYAHCRQSWTWLRTTLDFVEAVWAVTSPVTALPVINAAAVTTCELVIRTGRRRRWSRRLCKSIKSSYTRSQAVARRADRTASKQTI